MQRTVIFLAFLAPASVLLFFSLFPTADPSAELPIFHFYIVVFAAFTAAVSSMLLSTALKPIAQTRHTLASLAFAFMGIIFFTHALPTPGALTSSFHPALKWSAWLTLLGGGIIFVLAGLDRPDSKPKWLRVRYIVAFMTGFMLVYLVIIMFFPQLLSQIDNAAMPWHENAVFLGTLALWLVASVQLLLIGRKTGNKTDGVLTLVAFWLALATVSMFQFPLWKISWWMYHFLLLASFLLTFYILVTEYEQARRFRLLRYYVAFLLVLTAGLTLATSYLFAEFASSSMPAKNLNSGLAVLPAPVNHADHGEAIAPEQGLQVLETSEQPGDTATPQAREGPEDDSQDLVVIRARITGLLIAAATMGSLFAALLLVVRRADSIINTRTEELALAYADLRHSEAVREDLASMIVHDLRNPLTAISTNLGLFSHAGSKVEASKRQRFLDNTKAAVRRMSALIDEILAVSKIEAGELQPNLEMVPVNELLTNGIETFASQAISEQKNLTCNCPSELNAQLDPDLMGRVVENLVNNAFKYTEPGGNISVSALRENGSVRLCIRDDGIGVPDDFKERIFDKFAQGSKDDNRPHRAGTGLGLAFCRFVVGAHHGRIWVEDVPGGGSDFVIRLPMSQQENGQ